MNAGWGYDWVLLLTVPTAGLCVRLFIIQHDCGHGSYFASQRANHWLGAALGLITLFPFSYWKKIHAMHHGTSGNLDRRGFGDVDTLTLQEYEALSWWRRFCYRCYRSMPVLLAVGPTFQLVIKHRVPWPHDAARHAARAPSKMGRIFEEMRGRPVECRAKGPRSKRLSGALTIFFPSGG